MATIAENLQIIKDSTDAIKLAIIDKGGVIKGDISSWAKSINEISSSGTVLISNIQSDGVIRADYDYIGFIKLYDEHITTASSTVLFLEIDVSNITVPRFIGVKNNKIRLYSKMEQLLMISNTTYNIYYTLASSGNLLAISVEHNLPMPLFTMPIIVVAIKNNTIDYYIYNSSIFTPCFVKDTLITLYGGNLKLILDITYDDELLVWNFDTGAYDKAKPLWIKETLINNWYYKLTFSDGNILKVTGTYPNAHRLFNYTDLKFDYANECVGKQVFTTKGIVTLLSCEYVEESIEYYNIITDYHMNLFANNILTSCRYNNLYPIKDMEFVKDNASCLSIDAFSLYPILTEQYIKGLRLYELSNISIEESADYVSRLENLKKEFDKI